MAKHTRNIQIGSEEIKLIAEVDEFKGAWRALGALKMETLESLRQVAGIESIASSTRIEGSKLTDREVEDLLAHIDIQKFESRDQEEVMGYSDLMSEVFANYSSVPFSENYIKQFHKILLRHSTKDDRHRGEYKKQANNVQAFNPDGSSAGVVFETASPFDTPRLMEELVGWFNNSIEDETHHQLIIIGVFIVEFLAIHPFQDGNGRLSRALTTLMLLRAGYTYVPYSSLESVIEKTKEGYYLSLRRTQQSLKTSSADYSVWLAFFLRALKKQKDNLLTKVDREKVILGALPQLSVTILELVKERGRISTSEIVSLTKAPRSTIKKRFLELVRSKQLIRQGKGRSTWYSLP